jgi:hypothetical protein
MSASALAILRSLITHGELRDGTYLPAAVSRAARIFYCRMRFRRSVYRGSCRTESKSGSTRMSAI